ncbi:MAG: exodeoxyribonuclease I [Porticoccaceae bacterium]
MILVNTLYWHDYETTGIAAARDRPLQFAGVRTDESLNVIGDPLTLYCQPSIDILPHPGACMVTGITPQLALEQGVSEAEFAARIVAELGRPGTCGVGYNSIRFDDEFSRYLLYRNFYDPYEREWKQGNSRWDIIDMLRLTRALRPEGIIWPDKDDGSPSFKLEDLTRVNGVAHESAHDALSDVMATIALARLVRDKQPRLYDYFYSHRSKHKVAAMLDPIAQQPVLHVSGKLPRANGYTALMVPLAVDPVNKNAIICFNLAGDVDALVDLNADQIRERVFASADQLPENSKRIPLKAIHLNRCPAIATPKLLDAAAADRLNIDLEHCMANWKTLQQQGANQEFRAKLQSVFVRPDYANIDDAEQGLYQGFLPNADKPLLSGVRASSGVELDAAHFPFSDARYRELLWHYRARNFPDTLSATEVEDWRNLCRERVTGAESVYLTLSVYECELDQITASTTDASVLALMEALRVWGQRVRSELGITV